jgi:hypothetical protein
MFNCSFEKRKLKSLRLNNLPNAENKEYISLLLEENINGLVVEGVEHLSDEALQRLESLHKKEDDELKEKIKKAEIGS